MCSTDLPTPGSTKDFTMPVMTNFLDVRHHDLFCNNEVCSKCAYTALGIFIHSMGSWEAFLEDSIVREMCFTPPRDGARKPYGRTPFSDANEALSRLRATLYDPETGKVSENATARGYILLHEPPMVCAVADHWIADSIVSAVMLHNEKTIERIIYLRHAAAHGTAHSRQLFQYAVEYFAPGSDVTEIGEFLVMRRPDGQLMLTHLLDELTRLAKQIRA